MEAARLTRRRLEHPHNRVGNRDRRIFVGDSAEWQLARCSRIGVVGVGDLEGQRRAGQADRDVYMEKSQRHP